MKMTAGRSPQQILFTVAVVIVGVWITLDIAKQDSERKLKELGESVGLKEQFLKEIDHKPGMPTSWHDFSLRELRKPDGQYQKLMKCRIEATEVTAQFFKSPIADISSRRPLNDLPPDWWPWDRQDSESDWHVPEWWAPSEEGYALYYTIPFREGARGVYLHYDRTTEWLHLWEFFRVGVKLPPSPLENPVIDSFLQRVVQAMIDEKIPPDEHLNLSAQVLSALVLDIPPILLPPGLVDFSVVIDPRDSGIRTLLALRGLSAEVAEQTIAELPMRSIAADSAPPAWEHFLPPGYTTLPNWFAPGAGPRWQYELKELATGTNRAGRWAGYDATTQTLYVWYWVDI